MEGLEEMDTDRRSALQKHPLMGFQALHDNLKLIIPVDVTICVAR